MYFNLEFCSHSVDGSHTSRPQDPTPRAEGEGRDRRAAHKNITTYVDRYLIRMQVVTTTAQKEPGTASSEYKFKFKLFPYR
eukprot:SAG31_NODE_1629_length_7702_cov_6.380902_8_plen_81_part_00